VDNDDLTAAPVTVDYSAQLHVFHYLTHSLVWTLTVRNGPSSSLTTAHLHAPDGRDMYVYCDVYLTRFSAENAVAGTLALHAQFGDVLGPVEVIRHRDDIAERAATAVVRG